MDMIEYYANVVTHQRLKELRAEAERYRLACAGLAPRRPVRVIVGEGLIGLGRLLCAATRDESGPRAPRLA
jgi:hypothetical protein